jgi:hypothetical protein
MKLSRVGKYTFETKDLCSLAQNLAENPGLKEARIFGYNADKFWGMEKKYNFAFMQKRINFLLNKNNEIADFVRKNHQLSVEDKMKLIEDKIEIPVEIHRFKGFLDIGDYEIENSHFVSMIYYILGGGYNGWAEETPDFVKSAFIAVRLSKNPLYSSFHNNS